MTSKRSIFDWNTGGGYLSVNGIQIESVSWGAEPHVAPTIVLLHEGLGCVALWRDFPARLAEATGFGVFAYSRAGYGASDPVPLPRPLDYMTREATDTLPGVLDAIGFRRGVLFGHSDGASIASEYSGNVSDPRIRGLVLVAPHFFTEPVGLAAIAAAREAYENGDLRARLARHHVNVDAAFRGWCDSWLNPAFARWSIVDGIEQWRVPALFVQGVGDQYGTLAQWREMQARAYAPVEACVLEDCRHAPHNEQQDALLAAAAEFLLRLSACERVNPHGLRWPKR